MDLGLALLLSGLASAGTSLLSGSGKQSTPFKGWMSPSLGLQDPYLLNAMYKRGLQYGIGNKDMFGDIMGTVAKDWPEIMKYYSGTGLRPHQIQMRNAAARKSDNYTDHSNRFGGA